MSEAPIEVGLDLFKALIWNSYVTELEAVIIADVPFFGLPIINTIFTYILVYFTDQLYAIISLGVEWSGDILVNDGLRATYESASEKLAILGKEKGITSPEFLAEKDKAISALAAFISFS